MTDTNPLIALSNSGINNIEHGCARRYQHAKVLFTPTLLNDREATIHTAYGTAVGAGVAALAEGKNLDEARHVAFTSWDADPVGTIGGKCLPTALYAVKIFYITVLKKWLEQGYELATINNRPAVELAFRLNIPNLGYYIGFVDMVLYHPKTGKFKIIEVKTMNRTFHEAIFANSNQDVSYLFIASAAGWFEGSTIYPVNMALAESNTWTQHAYERTSVDYEQFTKSLILAAQRIQLMEAYEHYPKNGNSCYAFSRLCPLYGSCDTITQFPKPKKLEEAKFDIEATLELT